jgi:hypothetical protein
MDDATFSARDVINQLGSASVPLPRIERDLLAFLSSSVSRQADALWIERELRDHLERSLRHAAEHEEKAVADPVQAPLYERIAQAFRDTAHRTRMLLDRLARNPDWP